MIFLLIVCFADSATFVFKTETKSFVTCGSENHLFCKKGLFYVIKSQSSVKISMAGNNVDTSDQNVEVTYSNIATLVDVDYPGKIVDAQKALKTLGGIKTLTKVSCCFIWIFKFKRSCFGNILSTSSQVYRQLHDVLCYRRIYMLYWICGLYLPKCLSTLPHKHQAAQELLHIPFPLQVKPASWNN